MGIFDRIFAKNKAVEVKAEDKKEEQMSVPYDVEGFTEFCRLILKDDPQNLMEYCLRTYQSEESLEERYDKVLVDYFSGYTDEIEDPLPAVITSDAGAPSLDDYYWYLDLLKKSRGVEFTLDKTKFSNDYAIDTWIYETAEQLPPQGLCVCCFASQSDDYQFTIAAPEEAERIIALANHLFPGIALAEVVNRDTIFR